MAGRNQVYTLTETSPAAAGTAAGALEVFGLEQMDEFTVEASLLGATGGTLDVYLQRFVDGLWRDWIHFPQLAAAAAAVKYSVSPTPTNTLVVVGEGAVPALPVNTCAGGHPGNKARLLFVAGASTSAGAAQTVRIMGRQRLS